MRWKFAFGSASEDLFFVTIRRDGESVLAPPVRSKVTTFLDEDEFLGHLIRAGLGEEPTRRLAMAVLLSVAKPVSPPPWTIVDLSRRQMEMLHLVDPAAVEEDGEFLPALDLVVPDLSVQGAGLDLVPQFYDLLMQTSAAVAMMAGPEHCFTFLNEKYMEMVGAKSTKRMLGKTIREALPELDAEGCFSILDRVYATGMPYRGTEDRVAFYRESSSRMEERYLNTVCQPIRDAFGEVAGVMVQSTDVTDIVLARDVVEHREKLLYRQWAELEAIYASATLALMVVDAKDYRILRLNQKQAEVFGGSVSELTGQSLMAYVCDPVKTREILGMVVKGKTVANQVLKRESLAVPGVMVCWLLNLCPVLSAAGKVESITLIGTELSQEVREELVVSEVDQPALMF